MRKTVLLLLSAVLIFSTACAASGVGFLSDMAEDSEYILPDIVSSDAPSNNYPLVNHAHYESVEDIDMSVEDIYITVYPTYYEGELITRKAFDKHTPYDRTYSPTLNAHIWQGNPEDPENSGARLGFDDSMYNCTIRVRGNSTRSLSVKNFKVKLTAPGANLYGYDSLNINKHIMDDTRTNNKMSMDLLQLMEYNMSGIKTKFMRLYINDISLDGTQSGFQDQGLYIWTEQPNEDYLKNHGLDPNGALYKAMVFEFRRYADELRMEDDPLYDEEKFNSVLKIMSNPDHEKLIEMLEAVNSYETNFSETFNKYFDEENYLTWLTTNILFGNKDAVAHNFLLYSPSNSDKWYFIPWDYDGSFDYKEINEWNGGYYQVFGVHIFWSVPFHQRYLRMEGSVEKISSHLDEMMNNIFTESNFVYLCKEYLSVLREFFTRDTDTNMIIDYHLGRHLSRIEDADENYEDDSFWFKAKNSDDPLSVFYSERIEEPINKRYDAVKNNYERFYLTLESPTAGYIQEPVKTDDGWLFRWDAAFDFQHDMVTYDLVIARDTDMTDIVYRADNIKINEHLVESLPLGDIYYQYIARDDNGHEQYPLNITILEIGDGELICYSLAHYYNDGTN